VAAILAWSGRARAPAVSGTAAASALARPYATARAGQEVYSPASAPLARNEDPQINFCRHNLAG
jgi:hypothetical protein